MIAPPLRRVALPRLLLAAALSCLAVSASAQDGWVNEIHYQNSGVDGGEFVEIVLPGSFSGDLGDYTIVRYREDGTTYGTTALSAFAEGTTSNGFTLYSFTFPEGGLQNGPSDGLALCYDDGVTNAPVTNGSTVQVLSYDGTFAATEGCADGFTSTDLGVAEDSSTPMTASLQLQGIGSGYDAFSWTGPVEATQGDLNTGQTFEVPTPTVSFAETAIIVFEGEQASFEVPVEIAYPGDSEVSVDVALVEGTATAADFTAPAPLTVTFSPGGSFGDVQTATFSLADDALVEGNETATFVLQSVSTNAQIGMPDESEVTVRDDDVFVINEIHADPDDVLGDANGDGLTNAAADEFVEIVNVDLYPVDLGGYTLEDAQSVRHTFPPGTVLNPRQAVVIFGGGTPTGAFGGSVVQTASTGSLGLNNTGDTVTLRDGTGDLVAEASYGTPGGDNQSLTRDPDLTGAFVRHTQAAGTVGRYSPGTRSDGSAFGGGPTAVRFTTNRATVGETAGTFDLVVELTNPGGGSVSVDVVFDGSGTAENGDVGGFSTATVTFDGSPSDVSRTVTVTISDDALAEFDEEARFTLANPTGGAVLGSPSTFTLVIDDDDAPAYPNLVINEYLYDPPPGDAGASGGGGDANNDGERDAGEDEFIEIVNTGGTAIDLGGFAISDLTDVRHVFPVGTVLQPTQAVVVFGGGDPQGAGFGGALVQTATDGTLSLGQMGSEVITLRDADGFEVSRIVYNGAASGIADQSLTRSPELNGAFAAHASLATEAYSPGLRADGAPFGGGDAGAIVTVVKGREGWRMLSAPVAGLTVGDLAAQNLVQGLSDEYPGGAPNVYQYDGTDFVAPAAESTVLPPGTGFIWYLYDIAYDPADAGITDGESESVPLPFTLQATEPDPASDVVVALDAPDPGETAWELLGNPYDEAIDLDQLVRSGGELVSIVGSVWDPAATLLSGSYVLTDDADDLQNRLAVWQGAFFENDDASSVTIPATAKVGSGSDFYGRPVDREAGRIGFSLIGPPDETGEPLTFDRSLMLYVGGDARSGWDVRDVTKLTPLSDRYATLAFVGARDGIERLKAQESRPYDGEGFEVPLVFEAAGVEGGFRLTWPRWTNIPDAWGLTLIDRVTDEEVNLRESESHTFEAKATRTTRSRERKELRERRLPVPERLERRTEPRFALRVTRATTAAEDDQAAPHAFGMSSVYPNPTSVQATVTFSVPHRAGIRISVFDVLGRKVATLVDGTAEAGHHARMLPTSALAAGVYLVRMVAEGFTHTRRFVVVP